MDLESDQMLRDWEDDTGFFIDDFDEIVATSQKSEQSSQFSAKDETLYKQIDEDLDYAFALSLQNEYDYDFKENTTCNSQKSAVNDLNTSKPLSIVDEQWELIDPHPDIHALFLEYDAKFFYGKLKGVEVKWSPRMTLCAGVCSYEGRGGLCSVRLSVPLLKLRPRRDLVETLLHEMIHAYLFVTHNNKDRDGHGPEFRSHMDRINRETGTRITVYHSFHDEVDAYRQHWWKCDGPCKSRRPYFGVLKRAMNRAPGPKDNWWADHQRTCGGKFIKIKEPDDFGKKKTSKRKIQSDMECKGSSSDIRSFLKDGNSTSFKNKNYNSKSSTLKTSNISDLKSLLSNEGNTSVSNSGTLQKKSSAVKTTTISDLKSVVSKGDYVSARNSGTLQKKSSTVKTATITDLKSVISSEDNVVSVSNPGAIQKNSFVPFQGVGQKLGGTSDRISYRNSISSLVSQDSSVHTKHLLNSPSKRENVNKMPLFRTPKYAKISNPSTSSVDLNKNSEAFIASSSSNSEKKLTQSPIEKFLSRKVTDSKSGDLQKSDDVIIFDIEDEECSKVSCPVCFILVKESEINVHLDKCLLNSK